MVRAAIKEKKVSTPRKNPMAKPGELISSIDLTKNSLNIIWSNKNAFFSILAIYTVVYMIVVQGFSSSYNSQLASSAVRGLLNGHLSGIYTSFDALSFFAGSYSSSASAGIFQAFLVIILNLAIIWTLRQVTNGKNVKVRARDAYYKGMYPLIQYIIICLVIVVELLPLALAFTIYNFMIINSIATTIFQIFLTILITIALAILSLWLICYSIISQFIVTLPDVTPMQALSSAKNLVKKQRILVMRKIAALPIIVVCLSLIIILPVTLVLPNLVTATYILTGLFVVLFSLTYLYSLYKELIND